MFIMNMHYTLALEVIALVLATHLMIKACSTEFCCKKFVKVISTVTVALSIMLILCTIGRGVFFMAKGEYRHGMGRMGMYAPGPKMNMELMKDCPMMKKMMEHMPKEDHSEE